MGILIMAKLNRDGTFFAADGKHTGQEPNWHDWESLGNVEFGIKVQNALKFYGYYCEFDDLKKDFFAVAEQRHSKTVIKLIKKYHKKAGSYLFTAAKLARMINQGMPTEHPGLGSHANRLEYFDKKVKEAYDECRIYALWEKEPVEEEDTKPKAVRKSPMTLLEEKISNNILTEIDAIVDIWASHEKCDLKIMDLLGQNNVPANGCRFVRQWLDVYLQDFELAQTLTDDQAIEGYSFLSKRELNYICKSLKDAIADVDKYEAHKKKSRAPRQKKVKSAGLQVKNLKYCKEFKGDGYEVSSVSAVKLPGAVEAVVINTKTNKLQVYFANGRNGFEVAGTSIKNFDEKKSYQFTIRKGKHQEVLESGNWEQFAKNKKPVNGRMNDHCVILSVK